MTEHRIIQAKPFLKWAGGKTQLLPTLDCFLPKVFPTQQNATYIEPFVGGGAMLFYMLRTYSNIKRAVVNDINPHLITTYKVIRDLPGELIELLEDTDHNGTLLLLGVGIPFHSILHRHLYYKYWLLSQNLHNREKHLHSAEA